MKFKFARLMYFFFPHYQACQIIAASTVRCMGTGTEIAPSHLQQQTCTEPNPEHMQLYHSGTIAFTPEVCHGRPRQAIECQSPLLFPQSEFLPRVIQPSPRSMPSHPVQESASLKMTNLYKKFSDVLEVHCGFDSCSMIFPLTKQM